MRIEFTVRGPTGCRDVAVSAEAGTPVDEVLPALGRLVGAGPDCPARLGSRLVAGTVETCGLRTGAVLTFGPAGADVTGLRTVRVVGGAVTSDPVPLRRDGVTVGRDPDCDLVLDDDRASRRHAVLQPGPAGVTVRDLHSTNGTTVDGQPVTSAGRPVEPGELVRVGDSLVAITASGSPPRAALMRGADGAVQVNRAPRAHPRTPAVIDRTEPARAAPPGRVQWLAALLPAVAGGLLAWLLSAPMFLLFALLSPVLLLGTAAGDRLHWRRERRRADAEARVRRVAVAAQTAAALRDETATRREQFPDPGALLDLATLPGRRLWEREPGDDDHLVVRIGSADAAAETTVRAGNEVASAGVVPTVPVVVDLRDAALGLAGPAAVTDDVARGVVAQLATLQAPAELDVVVATGNPAHWSWCRWLPHLRAAPLPGPDAAATSLAWLAALRDRRREAGSGTGPRPGRWTVVVADRLTGADAAALAALLADGPRHGITAVCLADTAAALPAACRSVADADTGSACRLRLHQPSGEVTALADRVTVDQAERVARALAPLTDARSGATVPAVCRWGALVPLDGPRSVLERWAASDGGARAVIGTSRDGPVTLDLVGDGPHALVAGTTGSGKSELLRTLVLALAAGYPPEKLSFLLVDYKGGAAFADAVRLPHTTGLLTDLDAPLTGRALRSLDAELRRRERLFAAAGVDDLGSYRAWLRTHDDGTRLARLVIVVDEFAELATELPEFVTGLVGVARRGRSLGVHLVLATQRPGSVVSAEIRANTALRIALRVTEPAESADVIGVPDAAFLDPGVPGRALARIGGRVVELQTGRVTDPDVARTLVEPLGAWRRPKNGPTGDRDEVDGELRRVVEVLAAAARETGASPPHAPWLPPLPDRLPLAQLDGTHPTPLGRLDRPAEQAQPAFGLDPAGDSVLVIGQARSGRTTTLLTAAVSATRRSPPDALQLHLVDGGGPLTETVAGLRHLGTAATRDSLELVPRLLQRLVDRPRAAATGPRTLLLVDDWDLITAGQGDGAAAQWAELLAGVVRTAGPDLSVLVAGGRSLLLPRFAAGFASRLVLALSDAGDYGMAGLPPSAVPGAPSPGSGVRVPDLTTFRIAHPGATPTLADARAAVAEIGPLWTGTADPTRRLRLRALPTSVTLESVRRQVGAAPGLVLGLAGDTASPCLVDVVGHRARLLVAGPARSGRSTVLRTAATEARRAGHHVVVVAPPRSPLREHARTTGAELLDAMATDPPLRPTLLVVDDVEACGEPLTDALLGWLRDPDARLGVVVAGRTDELLSSYRGLVAEVRRDRCGLLLRPGPLDGDLLGVRVRPAVGVSPAGRGVVVGDPRWGPPFTADDAVAVQVALP